jgi:hypothetical protein
MNMARIESLNMLNTEGAKAYLAEAYGKVIENVQKNTISAKIKNKDLSGDPTAGTVIATRLANTTSSAYGTARSGGKGQAVKKDEVVIAINTDRELINDVEEKDARLGGVDNLITRKSAMDEKSMTRELERAFFGCASTEGNTATLTKTTVEGKVEELIQLIEGTKNEYVDGVERDMINIVCSPAVYGDLRIYLDKSANANVNTGVGECGTFHGVNVYSSVYLADGDDMVGIVDGAIAQPVTTDLDEADKYPASNCYHFGMFYSYGTKAVAPDLIQVVKA